jgi:hypothetical protein
MPVRARQGARQQQQRGGVGEGSGNGWQLFKISIMVVNHSANYPAVVMMLRETSFIME